jgi:alpha-N-arabinofuranosidase
MEDTTRRDFLQRAALGPGVAALNWLASFEPQTSSSGQVPVFTIFPIPTVEKPVNPLIYGNFIEVGFGRQTDGMWSELLYNRSFEVFEPANLNYINHKAGDDLSHEPWYHSGYEEKPWYVASNNPEAEFTLNRFWAFRHGLRAAKLTNRSATTRAYLAQDGIVLRANTDYNFSGWISTGDVGMEECPPVRVRVGLYPENDFSKPLAEKEWTMTNGDLQEFQTTLSPRDFQGRSCFAVSIDPQKSAVFDCLSLKPADNLLGWRKEVVEAVKRVNPSIIRFPGGCFASFYRWRDGIGPVPDRHPGPSVPWFGLENNDVGTAEFIQLCRMVGAQPFICLNLMTGSADEAADWVAYCNADESHRMGALRIAHGFREPFNVKYWELDNEPYRRFGAMEYTKRCIEFSKAVKKVDPAVKLVMVGYWRYNLQLAKMLEIAGEHIDCITDRSADSHDLEIINAYNAKHYRHITLCNTEWGLPDDPPGIAPGAINRPPRLEERSRYRNIQWGYAMNGAAMLSFFQRLGGDFEFANFNNMANSWGQNVIECAKEGVYLSAPGRVFELLSRSPAAWPLKYESANAKDGSLLIQPAWDRDKKRVVIAALNYRHERATVQFDLSQLHYEAGNAEIQCLYADSRAAINTLSDPGRIKRKDSTLAVNSSQLSIELPAYSVTHVVLGKG